MDVPTEQPRKLRCLQDPPAWPGCSLAMERVAPSQAQRVTPSAVTVDERDTEDCATTKGQQPTTLHPSKGSGHRRGARRSTVAPLLPLARSPAARVFPCPPAGSNTHNTSPRPFGRAGRGLPLLKVSNQVRQASGESWQTDCLSPPRSACTNWPRRTLTSWQQTGGGILWTIGVAIWR